MCSAPAPACSAPTTRSSGPPPGCGPPRRSCRPPRDPGEPDLAEVAALAGAMLRFAGGPDAEGAARLERSLERLAALPAAAARRDDVAAVVLHGRLVAAM